MKFKSISTKLQLVFTIIILIILTVVSTLTYSSNKQINDQAEVSLHESSILLEELIHIKSDDAKALAMVYAEDGRIIEALKNKDREKISEIVDPIFDHFKEETGLSVFEIGDHTGTVFYRGHKPEKFGDDKSSKSTIKSALAGNTIAGTETGSSGIAIRAFAPIKDKGKIIGTMQIGFSDEFFESYKKISPLDVLLFNKESLLYSTNPEFESQYGNAINTFTGAEFLQESLSGKSVDQKTKDALIHTKPILEPAEGKIIGVFELSFSLEEINKQVMRATVVNGIILALITGFILITLSNFNQNISKPIIEFSDIIEKMAANNFTTKNIENTQCLDKHDETGKLSRAILSLTANLSNTLKSLISITETLNSNAMSLNTNANTGAQTIEEINSGFQEFAEGIQDQANDINNSVSSLYKLSDFIEENQLISNRILESTQAIESNQSHSESSLVTMTESFKVSLDSTTTLSHTVTDLLDSSKQIEAILTVIQNIAHQTNLLALNASIEAARAGEHGKGFAVVADEIRQLAEQTSQSTESINEITHAIVKNIDHVKSGMDQSSSSLVDANNRLNDMASALGEISEKVRTTFTEVESLIQVNNSINTSKDTVLSSLESISAVVEESAATAEEITASLEMQDQMIKNISKESHALSDVAKTLETETSQFEI